jgi:pilus assembly protein TadC
MAKKDERPAIGKKETETLSARPFRRIGAMLPRSIRSYFDERLGFAGIREDARVWLGIRILLSFNIAGLFLLIYLIAVNPATSMENIIASAGVFAGGFALTLMLLYLQLYFVISDRASVLEKALPDFLLLTVSNLRAGMTPFASFVRAARPEFGALHEEVMRSAGKTSGTASLTEALGGMGAHFDSRIFRRTIALFAKGMQSGGQLASLLHSSADEVQHIQDLRAELETSTRTYTLFLGFVTIIVMPFLLSVSTLFVDIFVELQPPGSMDIEAQSGIPTFSGNITITPDEMRSLSIVTLVLTSLMVSALSGIISRGKALYGVKYFPVFAIASVGFFFLAHAAIGTMLGGFRI